MSLRLLAVVALVLAPLAVRAADEENPYKRAKVGDYAKYEPEVLKYIVQAEYLDFPDLVLRLLERGESVHAYPADCLWLDIGRPSDYAEAQRLVGEEPSDIDHV